ncbi:MAG: hypothetical protein RL154_1470 [Pseudomonadota bacterium]|jgi:PAS domain S-box-containing protein
MANSEKSFPADQLIVSKTDLKGNITYGNRLFIEMAGYEEYELLGAPHNIIRHTDMPKAVFKLVWETISSKKEIFGYVKNLTKSGDYYWVLANITPSIDNNGNIIGYFSVRRVPSKNAVLQIEQIYAKMCTAEKNGGVNAGFKVLVDILNGANTTYDKLMAQLIRG